MSPPVRDIDRNPDRDVNCPDRNHNTERAIFSASSYRLRTGYASIVLCKNCYCTPTSVIDVQDSACAGSHAWICVRIGISGDLAFSQSRRYFLTAETMFVPDIYYGTHIARASLSLAIGLI